MTKIIIISIKNGIDDPYTKFDNHIDPVIDPYHGNDVDITKLRNQNLAGIVGSSDAMYRNNRNNNRNNTYDCVKVDPVKVGNFDSSSVDSKKKTLKKRPVANNDVVQLGNYKYISK